MLEASRLEDKTCLVIEEVLLQPDRILVRVNEAFDPAMELLELFLSSRARGVHIGELVVLQDSGSVNRLEQICRGRAFRNEETAGHIHRIDDGDIARDILTLVKDHVCDMLVTAHKTPYLQDAWVRDLDRLFAQFDAIMPDLVPFTPDRRELVDATQRRLVVGRRELGAHAPDADLGALLFEARDDVLVEVI